MKIQFRIYPTQQHVGCIFGFGCVVYAICVVNAFLNCSFDEVEMSVLDSRGLNVTHNSLLSYCELPYDDCLCTVLLNKSHNSEKCITHVQLVSSRILPFVSFFLQIYLVQKLFSLNSDCPRVVIYTSCILSIFTFIGMTIGIFWSRCYHGYISYTFLITGSILCIPSVYNLTSNAERVRTSPHRNKTVVIHTAEKNNKMERAWEELP